MRAGLPRTRTLVTGLVLIAAAAAIVTGCGTEGNGGSTATPTATTTAAAVTYRDARGDVTPGQPDITGIRIAGDERMLRIVVRFASAPPLSASAAGGWTDMLLMGIDVPPIGSPPTPSGWAGLDYALGMHGVDDRAVFRAMQPGFGLDGATGGTPALRTLRSQVSGREIRVEVPRALLGAPAYFEFQAAAGREGGDESATGDLVPDTGTLRYPIAGDGG